MSNNINSHIAIAHHTLNKKKKKQNVDDLNELCNILN